MYALDTTLGFELGASRDQMDTAMEVHIIAQDQRVSTGEVEALEPVGVRAYRCRPDRPALQEDISQAVRRGHLPMPVEDTAVIEAKAAGARVPDDHDPRPLPRRAAGLHRAAEAAGRLRPLPERPLHAPRLLPLPRP